MKRSFRILRWKWLVGKHEQQRHYFKKRRHSQSLLARYHRRIKWTLRIVLLLMALDIFYIITIWPNWDRFEHGPVAKSAFIKHYEAKRRTDKSLPRVHWQPVSLSKISPHIQKAVIVAEDARFYSHSGFDVIALKDAMDYNIEKLEMKYGASTISQQVVKNMFFSASRDPLRKWHELIFTISMEFFVPKKKILEVYLNIAEFGKGIYGVEAASRFYWNKPARRLTLNQAAMLAATLPSPKKHNPKTKTTYFKTRTKKIFRYM
ncbi:MAG: monofunctional biosynthetic peptidoglycan transglycosylase [Gammaproteobacteria bacterium]|nr:monofunctional biosynthetic peptidoglycan transglycosylase [Gammaproteobacteria bacterium]